MYSLWLPLLLIFSLCQADDLTAAPASSDLGRLATNASPAQSTSRQPDKWSNFALHTMVKDKKSREQTATVAFNYDGSVSTDIIFKDDSALPGGSHYRTIWPLLVQLIRSGSIRRGLTLFDYSLGGNSAIALAHFAKLIQLKLVVFVTRDISGEKFSRLVALDAIVKQVEPWQLESSVLNEAARTKGSFVVNSAGAPSLLNVPDDPELNIYQETLKQLRDEENITSIDYFISGAVTGCLLRSISLAASPSTKVVAVDSEFSPIYDFLVNNRFQTMSGSTVWRSPGIPELGTGLVGPLVVGKTISVSREMVDKVIKVPDLATVAAMHVLQARGVAAGPSTAANFLAALVIASTESAPGTFMTIVAVMEDSSSLYQDTFLDETWVKKTFGRLGAKWGFDCWKRAIDESISTGWNPLNSGLDRGCPTGWK